MDVIHHIETGILCDYSVDSERLAQDLATMELFSYTDTYGEFVCGAWKSCAIWNGSGMGGHTSLDPYQGSAVLTDLGGKLPYVQELVGGLFDTSHLRYGRIARLTPGSVLVPHRDYLELDSDLIRIHLPLETDDACVNSDERTIYHMNVGEVWFLDATKTHSAFSTWDRNRTHLVLDFRAPSIADIITGEWAHRGIPAERTIARTPIPSALTDAFLAASAVMNIATYREFLKIAITMFFRYDIAPDVIFDLLEAGAADSGDAAVTAAVEPMRTYFLKARPAVR